MVAVQAVPMWELSQNGTVNPYPRFGSLLPKTGNSGRSSGNSTPRLASGTSLGAPSSQMRQPPVGQRFGDMRLGDLVDFRKVRDSARHFQHPVIAARRQ